MLQPSEYRKLRRELDELWGVPTIPQQVRIAFFLGCCLGATEPDCGVCPPSRSRRAFCCARIIGLLAAWVPDPHDLRGVLLSRSKCMAPPMAHVR